MCLYWHRQPSFRFQLVTLRLVLTNVSHIGPFLSTVWKNDCTRSVHGHQSCNGCDVHILYIIYTELF